MRSTQPVLKFTKRYGLFILSIALCSASVPHNNSNDKYGDLALGFRISHDQRSISKKAFSDLNDRMDFLDKVFLIENLCDPGCLHESRMQMSSLLVMINNCEMTYRDAMDTAEMRVKSANFQDDDFKVGYIRGFNKSRMESQKLFSEYFNIERAIISKIDEFLAFLESIDGGYHEIQGSLVFQDGSHHQQYNLFINELGTLGAQEQTILNALQEFAGRKAPVNAQMVQ